MAQNLSLFRDIRHYLSGRAALLVLGFMTFPLMTRILSVSQYGVVSLALRVVLLLTVLSKCGLQYSAARFYNSTATEQSVGEQRRFYSTLVLGPMLTSLAVFSVYIPVILFARGSISDTQLFRCLLLAPLLVILRTLQTILLSFLRNEGRSLLHSCLEVAAKVLTLGAFLALLFGGLRNAFSILVATAASEGVIVLFQIGMLIRRDVLRARAVDWSFVKLSLAFGAPLIAYELSSIVLDSGDRFLVRYYLGDLSLGYYSAAYNISSYLQDTLMSPLNLAIVPVYMRLWNEKGREPTQTFLSKALSWFIASIIVISVLTALCSGDALIVLASPRFAEATHLLPILIPGLMLYAMHIFLNVGLILGNRSVLMASLVFASALINLGINVLFIPRFGLSGAAWATLISYLILIVVLAAVNQRILPLRLDIGIIWPFALASCLAFIPPAFIHTPYSLATLLARSSTFMVLMLVCLAGLSRDFRVIGLSLWRSAGKSQIAPASIPAIDAPSVPL